MKTKDKVIAHWKRMREDAPGVWEKGRESPSSASCDFCTRYRGIDIPPCEGCPIMIATGMATCARGPYLEAQLAWVAYKDSGWDESQREWWVLKADAMITFLEAL